ncbi:peptidylprolyl isomerase [Flavobacterium sp. CS20]|uniref:peptidylprolyl isomerase n=1 Tax=Flavobacterium sp. CS20 TaxID=2775246 RepID=UPI001B3A44A4|nr:peptidylprolyl isomerase [Flavobacterium sp. CS20]QTY27760.1 peptidylprolyl isomerase [Flavobacterium sp. CS20]
MKYFYLTILFLSFNFITAQRALFNQRYTSEAEDFKIDQNKLNEYKKEGQLIIFNEEKHKTKLVKTLLKSRQGKTKTFDKGFFEEEYKILSKQKIPHYRVRYILIDKDRFDTEKAFNNYANKVRELLKTNAFKSVAMQYSMDYNKNVGGDSGWFKKGKTHPVFFAEVTNTNRLSEEIFEFEIPENNWYYFVKKSHSKKDIEEALVLKQKTNK